VENKFYRNGSRYQHVDKLKEIFNKCRSTQLCREVNDELIKKIPYKGTNIKSILATFSFNKKKDVDVFLVKTLVSTKSPKVSDLAKKFEVMSQEELLNNFEVIKYENVKGELKVELLTNKQNSTYVYSFVVVDENEKSVVVPFSNQSFKQFSKRQTPDGCDKKTDSYLMKLNNEENLDELSYYKEAMYDDEKEQFKDEFDFPLSFKTKKSNYDKPNNLSIENDEVEKPETEIDPLKDTSRLNPINTLSSNDQMDIPSSEHSAMNSQFIDSMSNPNQDNSTIRSPTNGQMDIPSSEHSAMNSQFIDQMDIPSLEYSTMNSQFIDQMDIPSLEYSTMNSQLIEPMYNPSSGYSAINSQFIDQMDIPSLEYSTMNSQLIEPMYNQSSGYSAINSQFIDQMDIPSLEYSTMNSQLIEPMYNQSSGYSAINFSSINPMSNPEINLYLLPDVNNQMNPLLNQYNLLIESSLINQNNIPGGSLFNQVNPSIIDYGYDQNMNFDILNDLKMEVLYLNQNFNSLFPNMGNSSTDINSLLQQRNNIPQNNY